MKWWKEESRLLAAICKMDWLWNIETGVLPFQANLFLSIFLVNLEVRSVITEGQFVFLDVLMENVTTWKDNPDYHWLIYKLVRYKGNCGA